jgi:lipid A 3-O-deacylase
MRRLLGLAFAPIFAAFMFAAPAIAQDFSNSGGASGLAGIFDEVRLGTIFSVQDNDDSGVIVSGQLYFRTFVPPMNNYLANTLLRPRVHVGGNLATEDDGVSQVYAGLTWNFPIYRMVFLEASFGGTWHDGPLESPGNGLDLGCEFLFHESVGIGVDLGQRWRVVAKADHSSHAKLCDDGRAGNSGITHAGVYVGYRF